MDIAVLYRAKGSTFWHDITRYLATTSKEILSWDHNIQNKLFEFDLEFWNPLDNDSDYIYIDTGAEIAVTNRTYTKVYGDILAGRVEKVSLPFDKGINENTIYEHNLAYKVTIQNHNFSVTDLSLSFEDILNLSELVNDNILLNAPLGGVLSSGEVVPKVILSSDVEIEPVNLEGSELDTLITALNQVGYLFQVKYRVEYDATNTINLIQYLKIFDSLDTSITDTWSTGLNVRQYRNGVIFVDEAYQIAESKLVYNKDASPVKNSLTLNFLVKDPNLTSYYKRSLGGEDLFYIGKAFDIKYVALYIDTTVSSVISSTVLELPHDDILKMRADQTRLDDNGLGGRMTARITNGSTITFINFTVDASLDRVTLDSALTVSTSDRFELVNCFDILEENLEEYPVDGYVQKHIKPGEDSYVKFFKYDMPRTGQDIVIWYYPVNDSPIRETFEDSKQAYGLRTLRENLNDIFVSETQAEQLFNEYKKLKDPLETISFESQRKDLLTVGRSISVNFGDINKSFTVTEAKTSILNDNSNKIIQNIKLSSYINNLASIIAKLRNQNKLKDIKANVKNKVSFSSTLAIVTSATQGVMNGISAPEALPATSITTDTFILNYNGVSGAIAYKADLSTSSTFDTFISGWNNKGIGTTGYYLVNGLSSLSGPFYYRVRAIDSYGNTSANSEVITVIKNADLQKDSYTTLALNFPNNYNDDSGNGNNATGINSPSFTTALLSGDTASVQLDGINDVIQLPNAVSTSRTMTIRALFKYLSFTRADTYLYSEWYGEAPNLNYVAKIIIEYDKSNNRFLISLYDDGYGATPNNNKYAVLATSEITLDTTNKNLIQFAWDNSTKTAKFCFNNAEYTLTQIGGSTSISTLNLKDTISPHEIYWGGFIYPNALDASLSPNMILAKLYVDNGIARDLTYHQQDWTNISSRL